MKTINIHEAKSKLSQLIASVEEGGDTIVICRNGKPVAQLDAFRQSDDTFHQLTVREDLKPFFAANFDPAEPVSEQEWPEELR